MLLTAANWPSPRLSMPGSTAFARLTTVLGKTRTREQQNTCLWPASPRVRACAGADRQSS